MPKDWNSIPNLTESSGLIIKTSSSQFYKTCFFVKSDVEEGGGGTVVILTKISETIQDQMGSYAHRSYNIPLIELKIRFVTHNQIFLNQ
jgi:hypothetical protein